MRNRKKDMEENEEPLIVTMQITDVMLNLLKDTFDIELDLLWGSIERMPDGRWDCKIEVVGYKKELFMAFMQQMMNNPKADVKVMGIKINHN
jgi:hypothetical protein